MVTKDENDIGERKHFILQKHILQKTEPLHTQKVLTFHRLPRKITSIVDKVTLNYLQGPGDTDKTLAGKVNYLKH